MNASCLNSLTCLDVQQPHYVRKVSARPTVREWQKEGMVGFLWPSSFLSFFFLNLQSFCSLFTLADFMWHWGSWHWLQPGWNMHGVCMKTWPAVHYWWTAFPPHIKIESLNCEWLEGWVYSLLPSRALLMCNFLHYIFLKLLYSWSPRGCCFCLWAAEDAR